MVERDGDNHAGNGTSLEKWRARFATYAESPSSDVSRWIQEGVTRGIIKGSAEERKSLAEQMGAIFSFVYDEETGGECCVEDLRFNKRMRRLTGMPDERLKAVAQLMVDRGVIKSKNKIARQRRANSQHS